MTGRQRFLAAAQMKPADVTPVWFMRQAGRSLPEYRALRERHDFMTVATTPELAAGATPKLDRLSKPFTQQDLARAIATTVTRPADAGRVVPFRRG